MSCLFANLDGLVEGWWNWMAPMAWQMAVLVAVLAVLTWLLRRRSARLRYALWLLVPLKLAAPPGLAFVTGWSWWLLPSSLDPPAPIADVVEDETSEMAVVQKRAKSLSSPEDIPLLRHVGAAQPPTADNTRFLAPDPRRLSHRPLTDVSAKYATEGTERAKGTVTVDRTNNAMGAADFTEATMGRPVWKRWLFFAWLLGAGWMLLRLATGALRAQRFVQRSTSMDDAPWKALMDDWRRRCGIRRTVRLRRSNEATVPMVVGCWRPTILLPSGIEQQLGDNELEAVLVHELQHVNRCDPLVNLCQAILGAVYFFHPLVWLTNLRLCRLREDACDEATIAALDGRRKAYGAGIVKVAEIVCGVQPRLALGVVESGGQVKRRLERILDPHLCFGNRLSWSALLFLAAVAAVMLPAAARPKATEDNSSNGSTVATPETKSPKSLQEKEVKKTQLGNEQVEKPRDGSNATEKISPKKKPSQQSQPPQSIQGRVWTPDKKPAANAKVWVTYPIQANRSAKQHTTTDNEGRFQFDTGSWQWDRSLMQQPWSLVRLVAMATGYGAAWSDTLDMTKSPNQGQELSLQLVVDVSLRGRVLDLEGQAVRGARVRMRQIIEPSSGSVDGYIKAVRAGERFGVEERVSRWWWGPLPHAKEWMDVDADGRFEIQGVGRERIIELIIEGPGIHSTQTRVLSRKMESITPPHDRHHAGPAYKVYGAVFDHFAVAGRSIVGVVRDKKTRKPLAGLRVAGGNTTSGYHRPIETDQQGRYEIPGCAKADQYHVSVRPFSQPYFGVSKTVPDTTGLKPITVDFALRRGIQVQGRVTDKTTGKPVKGHVQYFALYPNHHIDQLGEQAPRPCSSATIAKDGTYSLPVLPGPGVLAVMANRYYDKYMPALVTPEDLKAAFPTRKIGFGNDRGNRYSLDIAAGGNSASRISQTNFNALELIDIEDGAKDLRRDITIDPGRRIDGQVLDDRGKPLSGATVIGLTSHTFHVDQLETDAFTIKAINIRRGRHLHFRHEKKNLGVAFDIEGDEKTPLTARLKPCATITGRLLDEEGEAISGATLRLNRGRTGGSSGDPWCVTEPDGRFRIEGVVPGETYVLRLAATRAYPLSDSLTLEAGQTKDLGEVRRRGVR